MAATEIFQDVVRTVQASNLNYRMEVSHFSATIHLKNSFLTDQNGNPLNPSPSNLGRESFWPLKLENEDLASKLLHQEAVIRSLQQSYENAVDERQKIDETNQILENKVQVLHSKLVSSELKVVEFNKQVSKENSIKQESTENLIKQEKEVFSLTTQNETLNNLVISLHSQLNESREKAKKELLDTKKTSKKK
jgi:hypothetical protein